PGSEQTQCARDGSLAAPWAGGQLVGIFPVVHPSDGKAATIGRDDIRPGLSRIEIAAAIDPQSLVQWVIVNELRSVELADEILRPGSTRRTIVAYTHHEHPFLLARYIRDRQLKQIWTFPIGRAIGAGGTKLAELC